MPTFHSLAGEVLDYGNPADYQESDEKAFLISFEKQLRTADRTNSEHIQKLQTNFNEIAGIVGLKTLSPHGTMDTATADALDYYNKNRKLFMKYGISNHKKAKEIEQVTSPAFTETEYAPTIEEMKGLDIDISELYNE